MTNTTTIPNSQKQLPPDPDGMNDDRASCSSDYRLIPLTKGYQTLVDADLFDYLSQWKWWALMTEWGGVYAVRQEGRTTIYMHRFIMDAPAGMEVDHRFGDTLDNRRANLRLCTGTQNQANRKKASNRSSSAYKGVYFHIRRGKWIARIQVKGQTHHLGCYLKEEEAAAAYNTAARRYFGDFALLNAETGGEDA